MRTIDAANETAIAEAAALFGEAEKAVALTGAGVSVASGIADFRSPEGLWSVFAPDEYATLDVFLRHPARAWQLYRALGSELLGKRCNAAHRALAEFEKRGLLAGVITQNVDNLHQQAGSTVVLEIHGDHQHLQCLRCSRLEPVAAHHYESEAVPLCPDCEIPLKPNVVLFGEPVRMLDEIDALLTGCRLLLVVGTSAQVYPAAAIPLSVKHGGGTVFEFNREQSLGPAVCDYHFPGDAAETLPALAAALRRR